MMTTMRLSALRVASSHGIEDLASAGMDWIQWWNEALENLVSAENRAQWMLACFGGVGTREGVGIWHMEVSLPLSSCAMKLSQVISSWVLLVASLLIALLLLGLRCYSIGLDSPGVGIQCVEVVVPRRGGRVIKVPLPVFNLRSVRALIVSVWTVGCVSS